MVQCTVMDCVKLKYGIFRRIMEEILGDQGNSVIATPDPEISEHYV